MVFYAPGAIGQFAIGQGTSSNGANTYIMSAVKGTFTVVGVAATLKKTKKMSVTVGTFVVTCNAATLAKAHTSKLSVTTAAYVLSGKAVTFTKVHTSKLPITTAAYIVSASAVTFGWHGHRILTAATATFVVTRNAATLARLRRLTATTGAFVVTGKTSTFKRTHGLLASVGAFAVTGKTVTLIRHGHIVLASSVGTFLVIRNPAKLQQVAHLSVSAGAFLLTGRTAKLHANNTRIIATVGVFTFTGNAAATVKPTTLSASDGLTVSGSPIWGWGVSSLSVIGMGSASVFRYLCAGAVNDTVAMSVATKLLLEYQMTVSDTARMSSLVYSLLPVKAGEMITMSVAATVAWSVQIVQQVALGDVYAVAAKYGLTMGELVYIAGGVLKSLGGVIQDVIGMGGSTSAIRQTYLAMVENAVLSGLFGNQAVVTITTSDTVTVEDAELLQMVFHSTLQDQIWIDIAYIAPAGDFTTWAINTRNNAVSEYQNYPFVSFTRMGNRYIAASSQGIYELLGDTDNGTPIPTVTGGGFFQPGGSCYTAFKAAYLGMAIRTGAPGVFLKLITGDGSEYVYTVNPMDRMTARVQFGKGLRSRYYAFELITAGADFDFDNIEFIPLVAQRRFS